MLDTDTSDVPGEGRRAAIGNGTRAASQVRGVSSIESARRDDFS